MTFRLGEPIQADACPACSPQPESHSETFFFVLEYLNLGSGEIPLTFVKKSLCLDCDVAATAEKAVKNWYAPATLGETGTFPESELSEDSVRAIRARCPKSGPRPTAKRPAQRSHAWQCHGQAHTGLDTFP